MSKRVNDLLNISYIENHIIYTTNHLQRLVFEIRNIGRADSNAVLSHFIDSVDGEILIVYLKNESEYADYEEYLKKLVEDNIQEKYISEVLLYCKNFKNAIVTFTKQELIFIITFPLTRKTFDDVFATLYNLQITYTLYDENQIKNLLYKLF